MVIFLLRIKRDVKYVRAVVLRKGKFVVDEIPEPQLGPGQLLVEPIAIGICGSDLSAVAHTAEFLDVHKKIGATGFVFDPEKDLVLGHEFSSRVLEVGDGVTDYAPGDNIVTLPMAIDSVGQPHTVGFSNVYPGGMAERVVVQAWGHVKIPNGLSPILAAVTEPLATGYNGVIRSDISPPVGAVVIGVGPVGLGAVVALSTREIYPIVASDPSKKRREIAKKFGAHAVVDPTTEDPIQVWREMAEASQRLFVFEASGKKGILNTLLYTVPPYTRMIVVGALMEDDVIRPVAAVSNNTSLEFMTGPAYGEMEYTALKRTLEDMANGRFDPAALVTGYTGFEGVSNVFELLRPSSGKATEHVKILIRPDLSGSEICLPSEITV